jgi:hypothetical protein
VTVLDNLEPQVHRSGTWPSYASAKAEYVEGDVRDRSVFEPLVLRSQAVREHAGNDQGFFWTSYAWNGVAVFLAAMLVAAFALGGIS